LEEGIGFFSTLEGFGRGFLVWEVYELLIRKEILNVQYSMFNVQNLTDEYLLKQLKYGAKLN